jgi:cell wall-associated protease
MRNLNGLWTDVQTYSTETTWDWNTTGLAPGTYRILVWAKESTSTALNDKYAYIDYVVAEPLTAVSLTPGKLSPQVAGTTVTFAAAPTGGGDIRYQFRLRNLNGLWTDVQTYSTETTWDWNTTGLAPGTYRIVVWAKESTSTALYDKYAFIDYVVAAPLTAVGLTPSKISPQPVGTTVTFTAAPTGGGDVQYQFRLRNLNGIWTDVQTYSTDTTWEWNTTGLTPGTYRVVVWAKEATSTATYDRYAYQDYLIIP